MTTDEFYLGIEIGGTKLQLVVADGGLKILRRLRFEVDRAQGGAGIRRQIESALPEILLGVKLSAVGVGFGGPVDWRTGRICLSHHLSGWADFDLSDWLAGLTHAPVFVDNDANVAALGEAAQVRSAECGVGSPESGKSNPLFYVTLGSGVGGGLVVDGSIYHGATPGEAEIGHVRLDRGGTILESSCSGWSVDAKIRALRQSEPSSVLCKMTAGESGGEARHLAAALAQNDAAARRILESTAEDLAFGLSHVVQLFHPAVIVIGGGLSKVGEPLRSAVERKLGPFIMAAFAPGPRVCLATLGEDAVPVGALELARGGLRI